MCRVSANITPRETRQVRVHVRNITMYNEGGTDDTINYIQYVMVFTIQKDRIQRAEALAAVSHLIKN